MNASQAASNPALTVAVALAAGLLAQALGVHLRIPGIILLLAVGIVLGPDGIGLVHPESIAAMDMLVGFAVAVILFEGGLQLDWRRLRRESRSIRRLISIAAPITLLCGALLSHWLLAWNWRLSILFGTLVMVTGPTVVGPLLKRLRVERSVATVLEAEGVLVDGLGAVVATVALEVALRPSEETIALGVLHIAERLAVGTLIGVAGGWLSGRLLARRGLIPQGLENVSILCLMLVLFQLGNRLLPEAGIVAAIAAGVSMGNERTRADRKLMEFKEQLTVMFIGMLFVLLSAGTRLSELEALGWGGAATVAVLVWVVRPLSVFVASIGSDLSPRQRAFVALIGPRGIVAAAVASFFAARMAEHGLPGGSALRAMVFLVIAVSVVSAGASGQLGARWLGVERKDRAGWLILGASELSLALAERLRGAGEDCVLLERDPNACRVAEQRGLRVVHGAALDPSVLQRVELDTRSGILALSGNDAQNLLFCMQARRLGSTLPMCAAAGDADALRKPFDELEVNLLFGAELYVDTWSVRLRHATAHVERYQRGPAAASGARSPPNAELPPAGTCVCLIGSRGGRIAPPAGVVTLTEFEWLDVLVDAAHRAEVEAWFAVRDFARHSQARQAAVFRAKSLAFLRARAGGAVSGLRPDTSSAPIAESA